MWGTEPDTKVGPQPARRAGRAHGAAVLRRGRPALRKGCSASRGGPGAKQGTQPGARAERRAHSLTRTCAPPRPAKPRPPQALKRLKEKQKVDAHLWALTKEEQMTAEREAAAGRQGRASGPQAAKLGAPRRPPPDALNGTTAPLPALLLL